MCYCKVNKIKQPAKRIVQKTKTKKVTNEKIVSKFYYNE